LAAECFIDFDNVGGFDAVRRERAGNSNECLGDLLAVVAARPVRTEELGAENFGEV
jgi:hypothetical protein